MRHGVGSGINSRFELDDAGLLLNGGKQKASLLDLLHLGAQLRERVLGLRGGLVGRGGGGSGRVRLGVPRKAGDVEPRKLALPAL